MGKLTFGELTPHTAFVTKDGCTWRKINPIPNVATPGGADYNAVTVYRKTFLGLPIYGHFAPNETEFSLASAQAGRAKQVAV
jgi:hypothetical protein